jgi:hypothetical protein
MRIRKHALRKAGVEHDAVAIGYLYDELTAEQRRNLGRLRVEVEVGGPKVVVKATGLRGYEGKDGNAQYGYWIEMSVPELAFVVRETMKLSPSADLFEAVMAPVMDRLPRQRKQKQP